MSLLLIAGVVVFAFIAGFVLGGQFEAERPEFTLPHLRHNWRDGNIFRVCRVCFKSERIKEGVK